MIIQGATTSWCLWKMGKSEGNMWRWRALRRGWSNSWRSPLHVPPWGLSAWLLPRKQRPGREWETAHGSLPCKTGWPMNRQKVQKFLLDDVPLCLHPYFSLFSLPPLPQVRPGSRCNYECFSNHVDAIHRTRTLRGLSVSKCIHSGWGSKRGQTTGGLKIEEDTLLFTYSWCQYNVSILNILI